MIPPVDDFDVFRAYGVIVALVLRADDGRAS